MKKFLGSFQVQIGKIISKGILGETLERTLKRFLQIIISKGFSGRISEFWFGRIVEGFLKNT